MEGSSSRMSRGSAISARPMASICCSPPDSVPACCFFLSSRRGKYPKTRSKVRPKLERSLAVNDPNRRLSMTLRPEKVPRPSGTCATPMRAISSGFLPQMSSPNSDISPLVWIIPQIARNVVVLPAPLAPRRAVTWPPGTSKSIPCNMAPCP